jgi:poly(A) polymerase
MTPVLRLPDLDFLKNAALLRVMDVLGAGHVLMVGGCVRAAVLGHNPVDFDLATQHAPEIVMDLLTGAGIKVVPTGLAHGTVTAVIEPQAFEITTLRRDVETDGRHAVVAFTDDWTEDCRRRDFTMNTLLMDMQGNVYDPLGVGVDDLRLGRVRFVGDARTRIQEDALRILRFFRFHAGYGQGAPDAQGLAACAALSGLVQKLSRERVTTEIEKLLPLQGAGVAIVVMREASVLPDVFQSGFDGHVYQGLCDFVVRAVPHIAFPVLFYYAVVWDKVESWQERTEKYLLLSNAKKAQVKNLVTFLKEHTDYMPQNLYVFGRDATLGGMLLLSVYNGKPANVIVFEDIYARVMAADIPVLPYNAADIMQATNLGQGVALGQVLKETERWWLAQHCTPDKGACVTFARDLKS